MTKAELIELFGGIADDEQVKVVIDMNADPEDIEPGCVLGITTVGHQHAVGVVIYTKTI